MGNALFRANSNFGKFEKNQVYSVEKTYSGQIMVQKFNTELMEANGHSVRTFSTRDLMSLVEKGVLTKVK